MSLLFEITIFVEDSVCGICNTSILLRHLFDISSEMAKRLKSHCIASQKKCSTHALFQISKLIGSRNAY